MNVDEIHPEHREKLSAAYDAAADYIEEHGWTQFEEKSATGQVCLVGGLRWANGDVVGNWAGTLLVQCMDVGRDFLGLPLSKLAWWNDQSNRTQDEVVNLLRGYANKLR